MPSEIIARLQQLPTARVWSMLVTIFGDLAQNPDDLIDGKVLMALTEGMGLKPEAVRVALHRLRNDDWITSIKSGRTARHALTQHGRKESQAASDLIYTPTQEMPKSWQLVLSEQNDSKTRDQLVARHFIQLAPRIYLGTANAKAPTDVAVFKGTKTPGWLQAQVVPEDLTKQYQTLLHVFLSVQQALRTVPPHTPMDTAVLRCLIVHHWRRLVLRQPYLPPSLTGADWAGHLCRDVVTELLTELPRPSLAQLQAS